MLDDSGHTYADATSCTWDAANDTCEGGDTVLVRSGSYGAVDFSGSNSRASQCSISADSGQTVTLGNVDFSGGGSWLSITGPLTSTQAWMNNSSRVTMTNWDINAQAGSARAVQCDPCSNWILRDSKVHNTMNANAQMWIAGGPITLDHDEFYDALFNQEGLHTECIYSNNADNVTMTRNHFWSCSTEDVLLTGDVGVTATNWDVQNNVFEHPLGPNAQAFHFRSSGGADNQTPDPDGFIFNYNTFGEDAGMDANQTDNPPTSNGLTIIGNIFTDGPPCGLSNTTYAYNVGVSVGCGTNNTVDTLANILAGFVDPQTGGSESGGSNKGDYNLVNGSPAIDHGSPTTYPSLDLSGFSRYSGSAPDNGAYEKH